MSAFIRSVRHQHTFSLPILNGVIEGAYEVTMSTSTQPLAKWSGKQLTTGHSTWFLISEHSQLDTRSNAQVGSMEC